MHNRNNLYLILVFLVVFLIGIGYAVLNTTLNINGATGIAKTTWDVHFENIVMVEENVTAITPATISENGTEITFTVPLAKPGDTYSFLVDIVNNGTIDAMLQEIITTTLTEEQKKYLTFTINYVNGKEINAKDALLSFSKETIFVNVGYKWDITSSDLATSDDEVSLSVKMNYIQDDGTSLEVAPTFYKMMARNSSLDSEKSNFVESSSGIDFKSVSSDTNGKGIYTLSSSLNSDYPIYYYRGDVTNNNVIFAGFCWKVVRTTETGGTKLIYNGVPDSNNACTATGNNTRIGTSKFNSNYTSLADVGYMYGTRYAYSSKNMNVAGFLNKTQSSKSSISATNYIYSDTVTYDEDTGLYTLVNGENRVWSSTYVNGGNLHKYTCFSETENTCEIVNYILRSSSSSSMNYTTFTSGEMADETLNKEIVYGNDIEYNEATGLYQLITTTTSIVKNWSDDFKTILGPNGYHYTCFTDSDTCSEVSYIYYHDSNITTGSYGTSYYVNLKNGKNISSALNEMFLSDNDTMNKTNSNLKETIENWYKNNMTDYTDMLEDTIWCNDRSISDYGGWDKDASGLGNYLNFASYSRGWGNEDPIFTCPNKNDSFTVDDIVNGNGKLTYPVGLLTSDELVYAGAVGGKSNSSYYLSTGSNYWTLSPYNFDGYNAYSINASSSSLSYSGVDLFSNGVRPAVSLKKGILYSTGNGTKENPYIVEKQ